MNMHKLAKLLNGREYRNEITNTEIKTAKDNDLVVVFGASDDLMELRGAIYEEVGCFGGIDLKFDENGILTNECGEGEECPYFEEKAKNAKYYILAIWDEDGIPWQYGTNIPHATFDILEEKGEPTIYCKGIVFNINSLKE